MRTSVIRGGSRDLRAHRCVRSYSRNPRPTGERARCTCVKWAEFMIVDSSQVASHAGDVGGEEVDAVPVEVAASAVVPLGGSWVSMAGQDPCVPKRNTGIECVCDRGMPK